MTQYKYTHPKITSQIFGLLFTHQTLFPGIETEWTIEELANNFRTFPEAITIVAQEMLKGGLFEKLPNQDIVEGGYSTPWPQEAFEAWVEKMENHAANFNNERYITDTSNQSHDKGCICQMCEPF